MEDMFSRTRMLLGNEAMDRLKKARVAVFGIGGVGGMWWRPWYGAAWGHWTLSTATGWPSPT